jgi:uncharacterized membrane protein
MSDGTASPQLPSDKTAMLILSYLGLLALIPLLVEKEDRNVQWHAKHGLVLFAAAFVLSIVLWILTGVITMVPGLGCLVGLISFFAGMGLWVGYLIVIVMGIMKALKGERFMVPGVSEYANRF